MPAPFSVPGFIGAIRNGGARPNQFLVRIADVGTGVANDPSAEYLCSAASLPGQILNPAIVQYRGREVKFAGDRVFAPWTTTFLNDTAMTARRICEEWMNVMESRSLKGGWTTPALYYGELQVEQLDRNGGIIRSYRFTDAFPIDISEVTLDYGANDQVSTFTCTWAFQQFFIEAGFDLIGPGFVTP